MIIQKNGRCPICYRPVPLYYSVDRDKESELPGVYAWQLIGNYPTCSDPCEARRKQREIERSLSHHASEPGLQ